MMVGLGHLLTLPPECIAPHPPTHVFLFTFYFVQGHFYFECEEKHGVLVVPLKVARV